MPTLNKLEYLDETKHQIKTALNQFDAGITDSDTFRSYVSKIRDIYDNWIKVTDEGTGLSLTPTKKGLMGLDLKGNTSQEGTPTPESPIPINITTGRQVVSVCGKNLFNKNSPNISAGFLNATGDITLNSSFSTSDYINVENHTKATTSGRGANNSERICFYDINKTFISADSSNNVIYTFNIPSTAVYMRLTYKNTDIDTFMVEYGSSATTYEEYKGQSYEIDLDNLEVCKMGTYQDYIYKNNGDWYIHKEIGKVVLNGSESGWNILNVSARTFKLSNFDNGNGTDTQTIYPILSSYFLSNKQATVYSGTIGIQALGGTTKALYICFGSSSSISDVSALNTWLSSHNVEVYYVLDTPTNEEITDTSLISQLEALKDAYSYDGTTNITQTNDGIGFIISATALKKGGN